MKILLTAVNSKFIHSNLAVYSLKAYSNKYRDNIKISEFTINHQIDYILREIYKIKPDVIAFSCYIWNINVIRELASELKKILPNVPIWLGGPEVSYDASEVITNNPAIQGVIIGEGEETFKELVEYYVEKNLSLNNIKGISFRGDDGSIVENPERPALDMSTLPFPYEDLSEFENRIIYYEATRGCPFNCSYCLSSIGKGVRYRDTKLVKEEFKFFLDNKVRQIKLVDRTFNCNKAYALELWKFLKDNDNGITNFHFEISADLLDKETIEFLSTVRPGLFQFEIGVQTTNEETIKAITRNMDFEELSNIVREIKKGNNIHQHLDLIAGLPYEGYDSFKKSFNDVYNLGPEKLQLGFLKVLKGSAMFYDSEKYGIKYKDNAPYEVLYTKYLSYDDMLMLKGVEEMVDTYYNSGQFTALLKYLVSLYKTPFDFYESLSIYYERKLLHSISHSRMDKYNILIHFAIDEAIGNINILKNLALYDLYLQEKLKKRPEWSLEQDKYKEVIKEFYYNEDNINKYFTSYEGLVPKQLSRITHVEPFGIDVLNYINTGLIIEVESFVLFDYQHKDALTNHAKTYSVII